MKRFSILILTLASGALLAQDAPTLDARAQLFLEMYRPAQVVVAQAPGNVNDQPGTQTGVGIRFMGELASAPNFYYEFGGMFDASSKFSLNDSNSYNLTDVKVTDSYWSLGAAYLAKPSENLSFGLHLEGRGEYLRIQGEEISALPAGTNQQDHATTYLRPWVRGSADYTFSSVGQAVHPYIGIEGSFALIRTSQTRTPDWTNMDDRTLKSMAPKYSGSVYAGVRF